MDSHDILILQRDVGRLALFGLSRSKAALNQISLGRVRSTGLDVEHKTAYSRHNHHTMATKASRDTQTYTGNNSTQLATFDYCQMIRLANSSSSYPSGVLFGEIPVYNEGIVKLYLSTYPFSWMMQSQIATQLSRLAKGFVFVIHLLRERLLLTLVKLGLDPPKPMGQLGLDGYTWFISSSILYSYPA